MHMQNWIRRQIYYGPDDGVEIAASPGQARRVYVIVHSIWKRQLPTTNHAFGKRRVLLLQRAGNKLTLVSYRREPWTMYGEDQQWCWRTWNGCKYWLQAVGLLFYRKSKLHPFLFQFKQILFRYVEWFCMSKFPSLNVWSDEYTALRCKSRW